MELARQGDGGAIATLIQQVVQPEIAVRAHLREDCLHILLEAEIVPEQVANVRSMRQRLTELGLTSVHTVRIYGRQQGETKPAWTVAVELVGQPQQPTENLASKRAIVQRQAIQSNRPPVPQGKPIFQIGQFSYTTLDLQNLRTRLDPLKLGFIGMLALYGLFGSSNYTVEKYLEGGDPIMMFLHNVNLIFHEAGHVIFSFFGEFLHILGGSLMQVLVPTVIAGYFLLHRQFYACAIALCWSGQSLWDVSIYIKDAQERVLPLLGGENVMHDWHFLLLDMNLLAKGQMVGNSVFFVGSLVYLGAIVMGFYYSQTASRLIAED